MAQYEPIEGLFAWLAARPEEDRTIVREGIQAILDVLAAAPSHAVWHTPSTHGQQLQRRLSMLPPLRLPSPTISFHTGSITPLLQSFPHVSNPPLSLNTFTRSDGEDAEVNNDQTPANPEEEKPLSVPNTQRRNFWARLRGFCRFPCQRTRNKNPKDSSDPSKEPQGVSTQNCLEHSTQEHGLNELDEEHPVLSADIIQLLQHFSSPSLIVEPFPDFVQPVPPPINGLTSDNLDILQWQCAREEKTLHNPRSGYEKGRTNTSIIQQLGRKLMARLPWRSEIKCQ